MKPGPTMTNTSNQNSASEKPLAKDSNLQWVDQGIETILILAIAVTPLLFSPLSRELFEFPKMVWIYLLAIIGMGLLLSRAVLHSKFEYISHPLGRPLTIYGLVFIVSTILSINLYTSILGYYSRFHGGLASLGAYLVFFYLTLIYLHPSSSRAARSAKLLWSWVASSIMVSAWAIAEHFGYSPSCWLLRGELNTECWVQDVQARVFATFGQPNWLATYLITTIPLSLALLLTHTHRTLKVMAWLGITVGYAAFWYTYSRSGWVGLAVVGIILLPWAWQINYRKNWSWLATAIIVCGMVSLSTFQMASQRTATALESGDLDSSTGQIRLLVWQGSLQTAMRYPLFGSGPETFPYSFLQDRPAALNQTTEWNFLYNKAHNEVLQVAVTTGAIGLIAWLILYLAMAKLAWRERIIALKPSHLAENTLVPASLVAGIFGVFTAQLLGFSVVVTSLYFWLATAIILVPFSTLRAVPAAKSWRPVIVIIGGLAIIGLTLCLASYYFAEIIATQASSGLRSNPWRAEQQFALATQLNPFEPTYMQQLALANAYLAQMSINTTLAESYSRQADLSARRAYILNPRHILNLKGITNVYQQLSITDSTYLRTAVEMAEKTVDLDRNDANAQLTLAQLYHQSQRNREALQAFNQLIKLRPRAANSYIQRSRFYQQTQQKDLALQDLRTAQKLDPNNREALEQIKLLEY